MNAKIAALCLLLLCLPLTLAADAFLDEIDMALQGEDILEEMPLSEIERSVRPGDIFADAFYRDKLFLLLIMAVLLALPGVFVCLKREFFLSLSIAQAASAGIALGMLGGISILLSAALFIALCLAIVSMAAEKGVADKNAVLFSLYVAFAALTTLILSRSGEGNVLVTNLLFGDLITVTWANAAPFIAAGAIIAAIHLLLQRMYVPVMFDPVFSEFEGIKVKTLSFFMTLLQGIVLGYAIRLAGMFFALPLMAIVPAAVLLFARSMKASLVLAAAASLAVVFLSFILAVLLDLPASAAVSAVSALFFGAVFIVRRR
jgi:ABC-type Mn2+/Zn2+ transport system permease subunit